MKAYKAIFILYLLFTNFSLQAQVGYDTVYTKEFGNPSHYNSGYSLVEISDDKMLLFAGYNLAQGISCDWRPRLYSINAKGDSTWSVNTIPGGGPIRKTSDGNFINVNVVHNISNCPLDTIAVCKFNINGDALWTKKFFFGINNNQPRDIIQTADGGYALTGFYSTTAGGGSYVSFVIKLDASGNTEWIKHFGLPNYVDQLELHSIKQDSQGGYAVYGFTPFSTSKQYSSYRLIKLKANGDTTWTRDLSLTAVTGYGDMDILPNDDMIFTGSTFPVINAILGRVDKNGVSKLYKELPLPQNGFVINKIKYIPNHNAYLFTSKKLFLADTTGTVLWESVDFGDVVFEDIIQNANKGITVTGYSYHTSNKGKTYIVRFKDTSKIIIQPPHGEPVNTGIYPNPVRNNLTIKLNTNYSRVNVQLFNMLGQIVVNNQYYNTDRIDIWLNRLPAAMYLLKVIYDDKQVVKKIIKY